MGHHVFQQPCELRNRLGPEARDEHVGLELLPPGAVPTGGDPNFFASRVEWACRTKAEKEPGTEESDPNRMTFLFGLVVLMFHFLDQSKNKKLSAGEGT